MPSIADERTDGVAPVDPARAPDRGVTLVELLIAIVLLGTVVGSVLVALRTTVIASRVQRDQANAYAWLQTAADVLYAAPRESCNLNPNPDIAEDIVRERYNDVIQGTSNPEGWPVEEISIKDPVLFWDGVNFQTSCFESVGTVSPRLQLIEIEVREPGGRIVESIQVVKGE